MKKAKLPKTEEELQRLLDRRWQLGFNDGFAKGKADGREERTREILDTLGVTAVVDRVRHRLGWHA